MTTSNRDAPNLVAPNLALRDLALRDLVLRDPALRPGADLLAQGRALARDWSLGRSRFCRESGFASEAAYKRAASAEGRVMHHAHIGFRDVTRTTEAMALLHGRAADQGFRLDRFGVTLDWSMGYPQALRAQATRGTGIVLTGPEDFARIIEAAPAAAHFGDFMLGLPGALDNTCHALAAGATAIGNLGQYFTFRLPHWDDARATTEATVTALGLIAAQETEVLVHSNLDDGFAGLFVDMASALGMVLIEQYIVEDLIGARLSHCYGHHFGDPGKRMAFHAALAQVSRAPGTMIYGNTVAYRASPAANYASLASYLLSDILALAAHPSGHAINPVPVTENQRIPDSDEILDAQAFAARLVRHARDWPGLIAPAPIAEGARALVAGGRRFRDACLQGLAALGVDCADPAALLLAIRRLGPRRIEALWGPGAPVAPAPEGGWAPRPKADLAPRPKADLAPPAKADLALRRQPIMAAEWAQELQAMADTWLAGLGPDPLRLGARPGAASAPPAPALRLCIATSDVHEHGKYLIETALAGLGLAVIDAGVAVDPAQFLAIALENQADILALSTYNGIALAYAESLSQAMAQQGRVLPVLIGGKLNQIPRDTNSGLPVDVTAEIAALGFRPCAGLDAMLEALVDLAQRSVAK